MTAGLKYTIRVVPPKAQGGSFKVVRVTNLNGVQVTSIGVGATVNDARGDALSKEVQRFEKSGVEHPLADLLVGTQSEMPL